MKKQAKLKLVVGVARDRKRKMKKLFPVQMLKEKIEQSALVS